MPTSNDILNEFYDAKESEELEAQLHLFPTYASLKTRVEEMVMTMHPGVPFGIRMAQD